MRIFQPGRVQAQKPQHIMFSFSQRCKWFSISIKQECYTFSPSQLCRCIVEVARMVFITYLHVFNSLCIKMWLAFCLLRKVRDWKKLRDWKRSKAALSRGRERTELADLVQVRGKKPTIVLQWFWCFLFCSGWRLYRTWLMFWQDIGIAAETTDTSAP